MMNLIRDSTNNIIAALIYDNYNHGLTPTKYSIYKIAQKYDLNNLSLYQLNEFTKELHNLGFISSVEYAILNLQFNEETPYPNVINDIVNEQIDRDNNIDVIKLWKEYIERTKNLPNNSYFKLMIQNLIKKLVYLNDIKNKNKTITH